MIKRKGKAAAKKGDVRKKKSVTRKAAKRKGYNPQTGTLTGRAVGAQERPEKLAAEYMAEGLSAPCARAR